MLVYERVEPEGRCVSPDGHECVESWKTCSPIPVAAHCPTCGKPWTIVTFDDAD